MRAGLAIVAMVAAAAIAAACGGGGEEQVAETATAPAPAPEQVRFERRVEAANRARAGDFPATRGRTLQQMADLAEAGPQVGLATSVFVPGPNRLAFGVIDAGNELVFAPTAVYVAPTAADPARGPFVATLDPLLVEPEYRSTAGVGAGDDLAAVYSARVPLPRAGTYELLVVSRSGGRLLGAPTIVSVAPRSPVAQVGDPAPAVDTDTLESAGGDLESIETRDPPDGLHETNLADVLGERPVAILFSTPALCESRICGPVLDVALQLEAEYGDRVEFIHQEVFVDNRADRGFRPPLTAFGLPTEPWLFTIDRRGDVAAALEGSFGIGEFRAALEAALR